MVVAGWLLFSPEQFPLNMSANIVYHTQSLSVLHELRHIWIVTCSPPLPLTAKKFLEGILGNLLTEEYSHTFNAEYELCRLNKGRDCKRD